MSPWFRQSGRPQRPAALVAAFLLAVAVAAPAGCSAPAATESASASDLERSWQLYQANDPSWPQVRDVWYARGGTDRDLLVTNLFVDMTRRAVRPARTQTGVEPAWKRSQRELLELGPEATVPLLAEALKKYRDPAALDVIGDTLARFGAIDPLVAALDEPAMQDERLFRAAALRALSQIGGSRAVDRIGNELAEHPSWEARAAAAEALGRARHSDRERATAAVLGGLGDADPFVVQKCLESLRELTGARVAGDDPAAWRIEAQKAAARWRAGDAGR